MENATNFWGLFYEGPVCWPDNSAGWLAFKAQARPKMLETSKKVIYP
jgi:hypothetical protein